jgi:nicotinamide mononucleotide transporter
MTRGFMKISSYFIDWNIWEKLWLLLFTAIIVILSLLWKDTLIGVICSLTGIWCVILTAKGRISNYAIGTVNIILYAIIAYSNKYYGEVMLNIVYFLPMQAVGLYIWMKHKKNNSLDTVVTNFLSNRNRIIWVLVSVSSAYFYGLLLEKLGGTLPFLDALSTTFSIVAMVLMAWRFMEQWILWIIVDVVTVLMWLYVFVNGGNDISVLVMWIAYLINAIYGASNWIKMSKDEVVTI